MTNDLPGNRKHFEYKCENIKVEMDIDFVHAQIRSFYGSDRDYLVKPSQMVHGNIKIDSFDKSILSKIPEWDLEMLRKIVSPTSILAGGSLVSCLVGMISENKTYDIHFIGAEEECKENARKVSLILFNEYASHVEKHHKNHLWRGADGENIKRYVLEGDSEKDTMSSQTAKYWSKSRKYGTSMRMPVPIFRSQGILQIKNFRLILESNRDITQALSELPLACCEVAWDGHEIIFTQMSKLVYSYGMIPIIPKSFCFDNLHDMTRKYSRLGFRFFFPYSKHSSCKYRALEDYYIETPANALVKMIYNP